MEYQRELKKESNLLFFHINIKKYYIQSMSMNKVTVN